MKKILSLIMLCLCMLSLLTSCGPEEAPAGGGDGILSAFSAETLEGAVCDQSILKDKKVTMINVWGTFCGPCISEMPDLAALNKKYADQGFQVVGIIIDAVDTKLNKIPARLDDAKAIAEQTGADYTHLIPSPSLNASFLSEVQVVPHTIFVNADGEMIGEEHLGSKSASEWEAVISSLLESQK